MQSADANGADIPSGAPEREDDITRRQHELEGGGAEQLTQTGENALANDATQLEPDLEPEDPATSRERTVDR